MKKKESTFNGHYFLSKLKRAMRNCFSSEGKMIGEFHLTNKKQINNQMKRNALLFLMVCTVFILGNKTANAQNSGFGSEKTTWHGYDRYDFVMDELTLEITPIKAPESERNGVGAPAKGQRRCIVVVPKVAAAGNPWSWQGCYWDHRPQAEVELLGRGFHIAFITPDPGKQWDAWYAFLVEKHGFQNTIPQWLFGFLY